MPNTMPNTVSKILTKLERKLSRSDYTILDPLLNKLGIRINRQNRTKITVVLYFLSCYNFV